MPTNTQTLADRFSSIESGAAAEMVVRLLNEMHREPSTKRFARSRAGRRERWLQLSSIAEQAAQRLEETAVPIKRRAVKTRPQASEPAPVTDSAPAAA